MSTDRILVTLTLFKQPMEVIKNYLPNRKMVYSSRFPANYSIISDTMAGLLLECNEGGDKPKKTTILVADDHPLVCIALRNILEKQDDFEVIAEVRDGEEAVRVASELVPDVIIMDISMPKLNGLEVTRQIKAKFPNIVIMVLTVHNDREHILGVLEAGAAGYLNKSEIGEEVVHAIRGVVAGETVLSPQIFKELLKHALQYPTKPFFIDKVEKLTVRQQEVLRLAARGMTNKEIAEYLNLSILTIKSYLVDIFSKLAVGSRTEAVIAALRVGIISPDDLK